MKNLFFITVLSALFFSFVFEASAQRLSAAETTQITFDTSGMPQWAKDLRRWDIVTFGVFPFSLFAVTFTTDLIRWYNAGDAPFSDNRYAPWPIKSAGAVEMTGIEFGRSILIAAGLSMTIALADFIIVYLRRNNERQRMESSPSGSVIIERIPPAPDQQEEPDEE